MIKLKTPISEEDIRKLHIGESDDASTKSLKGGFATNTRSGAFFEEKAAHNVTT